MICATDLTTLMEPASSPPRAKALAILGICVWFWLASLGAVHPLGHFSVNDDWSFGLAVKHLVENRDFRPTGWTAMPLITNVLGAPVPPA